MNFRVLWRVAVRDGAVKLDRCGNDRFDDFAVGELSLNGGISRYRCAGEVTCPLVDIRQCGVEVKID